MSLFNHKISLQKLLHLIPESELVRISEATKVDYRSKVLSGKLLFYLLLYGFLQVDKLSQRGLADAFSSPVFRTIFDFKGKKKISHSSISDRLSVINVDFFRNVYEIIYEKFSSLYTACEISGMRLQRVDSTLVRDASRKLRNGLTCGNNNNGKMLKYTINFDGMYASLCQIYNDDKYAAECITLQKNIVEYCKKDKDHANIYVFDRGQNSAAAFAELSQNANILFVGRLQEKRKLNIVKELELDSTQFEHGILLQDSLAQIYKREDTVDNDGKKKIKI